MKSVFFLGRLDLRYGYRDKRICDLGGERTLELSRSKRREKN